MDSQDKASHDVREVSPPASANAEEPEVPLETTAGPAADGETKVPGDRTETNKKAGKDKGAKKRAKGKQNKAKKRAPVEDTSDSSDDDDLSSSSSSYDSDDSNSESEDKKKRNIKKRQDPPKSKRKAHTKKSKKGIMQKATESDSDSDSETSETEDVYDSDGETVPQGGQKGLTKQLRNRLHDQRSEQQELTRQLQQLLQLQVQNGNPYQFTNTAGIGSGINQIYGRNRRGGHHGTGRSGSFLSGQDPGHLEGSARQQTKSQKRRVKATKLDYKRVDQVWDNTIHNYKLQDTAEGTPDAQYDQFLFHVRRTFDWEGKFKATIVDIKSKHLRECLQDVMGNIKGVSLVEDTPKLDPNMLFLYLEDLRQYRKNLKKDFKKELRKSKASGSDRHERKKEQKRLETKLQHLKVLLKYIDKDYAEVKNNLYPMLENGLITFDLLWALWKPNTLAFTTTYGSQDQPRVFKVEVAEKHYNIMKGDFYYIEGKYFEYDGKQFGFGSMSEETSDFRGARKITSLHTYPLKYHKNESQLRKELIERGKKFVSLNGVHYKSHQGMAYYKKKKSVIKVNINGRIMIDPSIHRRINPNYPVSMVRPKDNDVIDDSDESDDESGCQGCGDESDNGDEGGAEVKVKFVTTVIKDGKGNCQLVKIPKSEVEEERTEEKLDQLPLTKNGDTNQQNVDGDGDGESEDKKKLTPEFSDEEYLIASPVVLGFAFAEKLWLEFTVSGVKEIQWNQNAYESLVLKPSTKDIVKALVESHKYHAAESIDDVIQGKGKGLVAVLHGPPGTGKTLTAEGISELLKCPLYMVSAGELGTDSRYLESELQKILDICHAWGAILLLDEADVFLEKRNMHDIHRNALVSIFLRQLEYFQGILFLTTNRVETFDDAFQSRIHIALRYDNLDHRARKAIFKIFVERVRVLDKVELKDFEEKDYDTLARHELNGRQIKNTVRTAQALAVNKREPLAMKHIHQVLEVQMDFDRDLRGGTGYTEAMRSYF